MVSFNDICSSVIPAGTYKVQLVDIKFKTSSTGAASNDLVCKYMILEGPQAKKSVMDTIYEKAFSFRLKPFLKAAGVDTAKEFSNAKELYSYGIKASKGKIFNIELGIRKYNGNDYNQVNAFIPLPSSTSTAKDVSEIFGLEEEEVAPDKKTVVDIPDISTATSEKEEATDEAPSVDITDLDAPF